MLSHRPHSMSRLLLALMPPSRRKLYMVALIAVSVAMLRRAGSPGHSPNHEGVLCEVNSLFPSIKENEQLTKGGVVVTKLRITDESKEQKLPLVYELLLFFLS